MIKIDILMHIHLFAKQFKSYKNAPDDGLYPFQLR